ncbi:MAG TPA: CHAT domain-containing protein [Thermoanaerobaculia bacterium]|nr:CHAT domain-containing protein [Thermoanaerobaculia bacterium]
MTKRQIVDRGRRGSPMLLLGTLTLLFLAPPPALAISEVPGIVVEKVRPGMTAETAGLQPGDVLLSWRREAPVAAGALPSAGDLDLPFDLAEVFIEQVPRGSVVLNGRRAGRPVSWTLPAGAPSDLRAIRTAPLRIPELVTQDRRARAGIDSDIRSSLEIWRAAAVAARAQQENGVSVWLLTEAAYAAAKKGLWGEADILYGEALSQSALSESPSIAAQILRAWGELFQERSSWGHAEDCFSRALAADRQKPYESLSAALSLLGLGYVDNLSAGPKDDRQFFRQAMEIRQRLAPGSYDDALSWYHLGSAALLDSQWGSAIESYQQAIQRLEKLDVAPLSLTEVLMFMAFAQFQQGDLQAAEKTWTRGSELVRKSAPDDFMIVGINQGLGLIEGRKGNHQRAEKFLASSLDVCHRLEPGSLHEVDAMFELGRAQSRAGKWAAASQHLCQAVDAIEAWRQRFQGDEEMRSRWGRFFSDYYRDCGETLVRTGHEEEAFLVLEKGRARAFLDLSAERTLRQAALPPDRSQEWKKLDADYDQTQEMIERLRSRKAGLQETVNLEGRLRDIRRKKERILEQARQPGSIQYPEPLSLAEARNRLEPGTVLLYYSVGETKTLLYILSSLDAAPPGWTVLTLDVEAATLKKRVDSYRDLLIKGRADQRNLRVQGRALYDLLVRPAEPYLTGAERVVISPDGPLHTLPFPALLRDDEYLIEWKPLHFVLSATAYADLLARRPLERSPWKLVAFGDPAIPTGWGNARPSETLLRMGLRDAVAPLPAARKEVEGIASLFKDSRVFLGDEVTESQVKKWARDASLVHFAVHGLLDERSPLDSGLILSPSKETGIDRNNGILQAWEVMEEIPLNADLVTLSACDTALGREIGGEGLIGLTRAFQYAGSRSVIGTLWGISDRSTSGFMMTLYEALREGKTKDEALREAQIAQIRSGKPQAFYWAGFQLFGDWR